MTVNNVLAVVPTADFDAASTWYERFAGRPADRVPMDGCSEWQLIPGGALQLIRDTEHAGSAQVTIGVDDLDAHAATLAERGLSLRGVADAPSGQFRIGSIDDPDGNTITFGQPLWSWSPPRSSAGDSSLAAHDGVARSCSRSRRGPGPWLASWS